MYWDHSFNWCYLAQAPIINNLGWLITWQWIHCRSLRRWLQEEPILMRHGRRSGSDEEKETEATLEVNTPVSSISGRSETSLAGGVSHTLAGKKKHTYVWQCCYCGYPKIAYRSNGCPSCGYARCGNCSITKVTVRWPKQLFIHTFSRKIMLLFVFSIVVFLYCTCGSFYYRNCFFDLHDRQKRAFSNTLSSIFGT